MPLCNKVPLSAPSFFTLFLRPTFLSYEFEFAVPIFIVTRLLISVSLPRSLSFMHALKRNLREGKCSTFCPILVDLISLFSSSLFLFFVFLSPSPQFFQVLPPHLCPLVGMTVHASLNGIFLTLLFSSTFFFSSSRRNGSLKLEPWPMQWAASRGHF